MAEFKRANTPQTRIFAQKQFFLFTPQVRRFPNNPAERTRPQKADSCTGPSLNRNCVAYGNKELIQASELSLNRLVILLILWGKSSRGSTILINNFSDDFTNSQVQIL